MNKHIDSRSLPLQLDRVIDEALRDNTHTIVDRDGRPAVVIMSVAEYLRTNPNPDWLEAIWADSRARGMDTMTMDEINPEIAAYRREKADAARRL